MLRPPRLPVLVLSALLAAACQTSPAAVEAEPGDTELTGTAWTAESIGERDVLEDIESFVRFEDDNRLTGHGGCNAFFGTYASDGERITIGPIAITKRACAPAVNDQERRFVEALANAVSYEFEDDLLLLYSDGAQAATRLAEKVD